MTEKNCAARGRSAAGSLARLAALVSTVAVATASPQENAAEWLRSAARPLVADGPACAALATQLAAARVIGLGEATHGQHEAFELKRRMTMELVREHGVRVVAYEASASLARVCDDYVQGRTADRAAAMRGFGMLIWSIEENAALLDDLRAYNAAAASEARVSFRGFDAQDGEAAMARIEALLAPGEAALVTRMRDVAGRAAAAIAALFGGDRAPYEAAEGEVRELAAALRSAPLAAPGTESERELRVRELVLHLSMYATTGGRDKAMAELLLAQLAEGERCVVWAHNGHVQKGTLRYLGTDEFAMGGHLAAALGPRYLAVGFAFGEGEFQANVQNAEGRWGFRRYRLSGPPEGSLEAALLAAHDGDFVLDLRAAPDVPAVQAWLTSGHGQRWFGGYQVGDDCDERTRDASTLLQTFPAVDFDALVFLRRTTAAKPLDPQRIY